MDSIYAFGRYINSCMFSICEETWLFSKTPLHPAHEQQTVIIIFPKEGPNDYMKNKYFVNMVNGSGMGSCCHTADMGEDCIVCSCRAQTLSSVCSSAVRRTDSFISHQQLCDGTGAWEVCKKFNGNQIWLWFCCSEDASCWRENEGRGSFPGLWNCRTII